MGAEVDHHPRRLDERADLEDLRADVTVDAAEPEVRSLQRSRHRMGGGPAGDGEPEFRVCLARLDVGVGVRVHTRRDADQDVHGHAPGGRHVLDRVDLLKIVDADPPDSGAHRHLHLLRRLVVAVHDDLARGHPGLQCRVQLAAGGHIHAQAFLLDDPADGHRREDFAGERDVELRIPRFEGPPIGAARLPQSLLVDHIERSAELPRQVHRAAPPDLKHTVSVHPLCSEKHSQCLPSADRAGRLFHELTTPDSRCGLASWFRFFSGLIVNWT